MHFHFITGTIHFQQIALWDYSQILYRFHSKETQIQNFTQKTPRGIIPKASFIYKILSLFDLAERTDRIISQHYLAYEFIPLYIMGCSPIS